MYLVLYGTRLARDGSCSRDSWGLGHNAKAAVWLTRSALFVYFTMSSLAPPPFGMQGIDLVRGARKPCTPPVFLHHSWPSLVSAGANIKPGQELVRVANRKTAAHKAQESSINYAPSIDRSKRLSPSSDQKDFKRQRTCLLDNTDITSYLSVAKKGTRH